MTAKPTAARRLVEALVVHGVDHVFCVPGESYLAVLDALADVRDKIRVIACRHEAGAANMAEAYAKLTGKPGICMVTRGPGATHGAIGVHTAQQDSTPLIMFVGQVARHDLGRGAFQEVDYAMAFGPLAKWADEIDEADRVAEFVGRAFAVATQGRQGPVVLALPEDMLVEEADGPAPTRQLTPRSGLDHGSIEEIGQGLMQAERPILVLGGSGWSRRSLDTLSKWIARLGLPTVLSFRRKDLIDNDHPCYIGDLGLGPNPKLLKRIKAADMIIAIGARLGENPTQGYTLFTREQTAQKLVHIHPGAEELNRVWPARLAAVADVSEAAGALSALQLDRNWKDQAAAGRAEYEAFTAPIEVNAEVNLSQVVAHMNAVLPNDAIICNGAGNYAAWLHRFYRHRARGTQLAPTSGAMGYGFPAAIAAKLAAPEREVVCFSGDGDFLMTAQEMATAVQYNAPIVTVVVDNGTYGTIRMHQERDYPGRIIATDLRNPDFAAYARSFGAWAATVTRTEDFAAAFEEARKAGVPALIHLITDAENIAPGRTITQLRGGRA
jgi:acetolactate synthase-1/2/3 large subunit